MDKDLIRQAVRAVGGRLKSAFVQAAKSEAARAVRHLRERLAPPPAAGQAPALAPPPPQAGSGEAERESVPPKPVVEAPEDRPVPPPGPAPGEDLIDVNTASVDTLVALKGIGAARAEAIVKGRPFARPAELVERRILPASVYEAVRGKIRGA